MAPQAAAPKVGRYAPILAVLLTAAWLLGGCSTPTSRLNRDLFTAKSRTIAVAPLANHSAHAKAGLILADLTAARLNSLDRYRVVPPKEVIDVLGLSELTINDGVDISQPRDPGDRLGVNSLITGTVTEYRYNYGLYDQPAIGFTLQLIDLKSGEVVWTVSHAGSGAPYWPAKLTLAQLAEQLIREAVETLVTE